MELHATKPSGSSPARRRPTDEGMLVQEAEQGRRGNNEGGMVCGRHNMVVTGPWWADQVQEGVEFSGNDCD